jgi:peptide/nickel transport system permease protein
MTKYVLRRILGAIPVIIGISIVVYALMLLAPGGPQAKFANNPKMPAAAVEKFKAAWGLDQPIPIQYCRWVGLCDPDQAGLALLTKSGVPNFLPASLGGGDNGMVHGQLGISIDSGEDVGNRIGKAALPTLILAGSAFFVWITIAILIGVLAAVRRSSRTSASRCRRSGSA